MYSNIIVENHAQLRVIKLNRPEKYNAVNAEMASELLDAMKQASADAAVRAILLSGEGKAFCSGQDLADVGSDLSRVPFDEIIEKQYNPLLMEIVSAPKPVIAYVNGVAAGAGANLALGCDIVLASTQASFIQAFAKIGLVPDTGGTWFLPRLVGLQKATALMMTGEKVSAEEAEKMNMIYQCLAAETAYEKAMEMAIRLSQMPTKALAEIKILLQNTDQNTLKQQLQQEKNAQVAMGHTQDLQEGVTAFVEKRTPKFQGK